MLLLYDTDLALPSSDKTQSLSSVHDLTWVNS